MTKKFEAEQFILELEKRAKNVEKLSVESKKKKLKISTAEELLKKEIAPLEYLVDGLLPDTGVFILAGASKMGKSWLAMDLTLHIAEGRNFFSRKTKQGNVLYVDLETGERSLKDRIFKLLKGLTSTNKWFYTQHVSCIGDGLKEELEEAIVMYGIKIIVIDVFVKVRSTREKTLTEYQHDYRDITVLKEIAEKYNLVILIVIHLTKFRHSDPFDMVCGSTGINGTADGTIILLRDRMSNDASLFVSGRELERNAYQIEFDAASCRWKYICTSEEAKQLEAEEKYLNNPIVRTIKDIMKNSNYWHNTVKELLLEMHKRVDLSKCLASDIPTNARATGEMIRKYAFRLGQDKIKVSIGEKTNKGIIVSIYK